MKPPPAFAQFRTLLATALALGVSGPSSARAESHVEFEMFGGIPWNATAPLSIREPGRPTIRIDAAWESREFEPPIYYMWRWSTRGRTGWSVEVTHHKLYLKNPPERIGLLSVSHGFNWVTLRRYWTYRGFRPFLAGGAIAAHPEGVIDGVRYEESGGVNLSEYHLAGPVAGGGVSRRWELPGLPVFLTLESRVMFAPVRLPSPTERGDLRFQHLSAHGQLGLGVPVF